MHLSYASISKSAIKRDLVLPDAAEKWGRPDWLQLQKHRLGRSFGR